MITNRNIVSFFIEHTKFFKDHISFFYPLSKKYLNKYRFFWDWDKISENENINWDSKTIKCAGNELDWEIFSINPSAFKRVENIVIFDKKIDWYGNPDWEYDSIASNSGIVWDIPLIEKYKDRIDFTKLSQNEGNFWSVDLIDKYKDKLDFSKFPLNTSIPWSVEIIDKYTSISIFKSPFIFYSKFFISNIEIIEKYPQYIKWYYVFANPDLPWAEKALLKKWSSHIDWYGISANPWFFEHIPNFFEHNFEKLIVFAICNSHPLSSNPGLPWSIEFIQRIREVINWRTISENEGAFWSVEILDCFGTTANLVET